MIPGRRAVLRLGGCAAGGAAAGLAVRAFAAEGADGARAASAAATVVLAAAPAVAAWAGIGDGSFARRLVRCLGIAGLAGTAALAAAWTAGVSLASAAGAAVVPASLAAGAAGLAGALRALRTAPPLSGWIAAALAAAPSALIFVADPWIEWDGSMSGAPRAATQAPGLDSSPGRAHAVLVASPLAAMTSGQGGLDVDWQRMPLLYDGPPPGVRGLSTVGQFYPSVPASPLAWGLPVLVAALALAAAAPGAGRAPSA